MSWGRIVAPVVALVIGLAGGCCTRKPAQNAQGGSAGPVGQVAAPPSAAPPPSTATPTTEAGCRACNGDFGVHGIDPTPKCLCRTKDGGKRCRGKDDCEAECVADGGEQEVTQPGPPPLGFRIGRCAEFRATFGCHVFLPPKTGQPVRLDAAPEQMCVD